MANTLVKIQSAWWSKINWTQAVGMGATVITLFTGNKYEIPLEVQTAIVTAIQGSVAVITWVLKTWYSSTVTAGSMK